MLLNLITPLLYIFLVAIFLLFSINAIVPFSFLGINQFPHFIEESKLFFVTIILPLLLIKRDPNKLSLLRGIRNTIFYVLLFIVALLPLTILTGYFGGIETAVFVRSNTFLIIITLFISLLCAVPDGTTSEQQSRRGGTSPRYIFIYYLLFFLSVAVLPMLYYLIIEFFTVEWSGLIRINPFYLFSNLNEPERFYSLYLLQTLIWTGLIVLTVTVLRYTVYGSRSPYRQTVND
ncbi:MAG: hypothetical protein QME51_08720 [Planctomycetota bacterium]|nr:hypothetical protein [Planctomycetota bacterium]